MSDFSSDTIQIKRVATMPRTIPHPSAPGDVDLTDLLVIGAAYGRPFCADAKQNRSYAIADAPTLYHIHISHPILSKECEFTVAPDGGTRATFQNIGLTGAVCLWLRSKMTRILQERIEDGNVIGDLQSRMRQRMEKQARDRRCKARRTTTRARRRTHHRLVEEHGASRAAALMTRYPDIWGYE